MGVGDNKQTWQVNHQSDDPTQSQGKLSCLQGVQVSLSHWASSGFKINAATTVIMKTKATKVRNTC